jgi:hypothetical protein
VSISRFVSIEFETGVTGDALLRQFRKQVERPRPTQPWTRALCGAREAAGSAVPIEELATVISVEFLDDKAQEIVARVSTCHDEMCGQRGYGRAHARIQVMPLPHAQAAPPTDAAMRKKMTT